MATMRSQLRRMRDLLRRYRIDRRLPPPVLALLRRTTRLRWQDAWARRRAAVRPVVGAATRSNDEVARLGDVSVATCGVLPAPTCRVAIETARLVVDVLSDDGIRCFVVDRSGDRVRLGIGIEDRERSLDVIAAELDEGWLVEWADRGQVGIVPAARCATHRRARAARSLVVFRAFRWGERALGTELGVELTFWQIGTSGQRELVGTRGHERFDDRSPMTVERLAGIDFPGRTAFPVGENLERLADPVDVVYTWVDGADPAWLAAFRHTAAELGRRPDEHALDLARYRSRDELRYSLRSVWAYCGWVRRIWVVTAGQQPSWLSADDDRITVVDHADVLPVDALPTFNSHAIESALHHIDGLAEHFVYFNDDMFVRRPLQPESFFTPNGLARVFQSGARVPGIEDELTLAVDTGALRGRELLRQRFGRVMTHKPLHAPYPLRTSVMEEIEAEFGDVVAETARSRFRSPSDLSIAASFAQHYGFATGRAVLDTISSEYVHVESGRLRWHLDRILYDDELETYCVNETHDRGLDEQREEIIRRFFDAVLPVPAPWERDVDADD